VASQMIEEVTAHVQSDSLDDAREVCADGTYFPNNLRTSAKSQGETKRVFNECLINSICNFECRISQLTNTTNVF
jgi:hypothetical protein